MKRLIAIISMFILLTSCLKDGNNIVRGDFDMKISAELPELPILEDENETETKASTQYTVRIKWTAGDRLSIINLTTGQILGGALTANSSGTKTTFSGSLNGTVNHGDKITYLYPAQDNDEEMPFTKISVDMSRQVGTSGSVPLCVYAMTTATEDSFSNADISFSFLMSYIMLGLSDIPASTHIKTVTLTNVTESFDLSPNGSGSLSATIHTGNIVLTPESSASATGVKTLYAAVPASASMERSLILETETSSFTTAFSSAKINNGYAYNTNISGFLVDDMWISDESMREYCLQHFDADGDGRLSIVEIAGVKEFPDQSVYPIPAEVSNFNELEYFYGLKNLPSFKNRSHLQSITIPAQITAIPDRMFYGCASLIKVKLRPVNPPALGADVFVGQAGKLTLLIPEESVEAYKTAEGWRDYLHLFKKDSNDGENSVEIETEDEGSMKDEDTNIKV